MAVDYRVFAPRQNHFVVKNAVFDATTRRVHAELHVDLTKPPDPPPQPKDPGPEPPKPGAEPPKTQVAAHTKWVATKAAHDKWTAEKAAHDKWLALPSVTATVAWMTLIQNVKDTWADSGTAFAADLVLLAVENGSAGNYTGMSTHVGANPSDPGALHQIWTPKLSLADPPGDHGDPQDAGFLNMGKTQWLNTHSPALGPVVYYFEAPYPWTGPPAGVNDVKIAITTTGAGLNFLPGKHKAPNDKDVFALGTGMGPKNFPVPLAATIQGDPNRLHGYQLTHTPAVARGPRSVDFHMDCMPQLKPYDGLTNYIDRINPDGSASPILRGGTNYQHSWQEDDLEPGTYLYEVGQVDPNRALMGLDERLPRATITFEVKGTENIVSMYDGGKWVPIADYAYHGNGTGTPTKYPTPVIRQ